MIFSLILIILIVIFLAFFIGKNISNVCTFWFFKTYTDVPVATLAFIVFAAGIIVALLVILFAKLKTPSSKEKIELKPKSEKSKEKDLKSEIKNLEKKNRKFKFGKKKSDSENAEVQTPVTTENTEPKSNE